MLQAKTGGDAKDTQRQGDRSFYRESLHDLDQNWNRRIKRKMWREDEKKNRIN